MTARPLPDDPADWPADAHELLGVSPQADRNEVRRAYTQLLRVYKPEHAPEAFRLLRRAYEHALSWSEFQHRFAPSERPQVEVQAAEEPVLDRSSRTGEPIQHTRSVEEEAGEAWSEWQNAPAAAYRRLLSLNERHPRNQDILMRLYWALKLRPQLDETISACDWVSRGLLACGGVGPLRELYRRELRDRPGEGLSPASRQLVRSQIQTGTLLDLAALRWRAAARLRQYQEIEEDLEELRQRWESADSDTWLRLLLAALDELAWSAEPIGGRAFERYCEEINRMATLKPAHFDLLARLDLLRDLAHGYQLMADSARVDKQLQELIAHSWTVQTWELEPEATQILSSLARQPRELAYAFDQLQQICPGLLAQIGSLLAQAESNLDANDADWASEDLLQTVTELIDLSPWREYHLFRSKLVQFCTDERVAPHRVAQVLEAKRGYVVKSGKHLAEAILEDWPLRYACQAHRLLIC